MEPPSYMRYVVNRNVVMRCMTILLTNTLNIRFPRNIPVEHNKVLRKARHCKVNMLDT